MKWTTRQDEMLIHFMREQCKEGKSIPGGFTIEGWSEITKQMETQFGTDLENDKLKNHFKSFKKWYNVMKTLHNLSGFGWDEDKKMVIAEDRVWDDYIAAHPDTAMYRLKCFARLSSSCEIFGDSVADGKARFASNDPQTPPQDNGGEDEINVNATQDEVGEDHVSSRNRRNAALGGSSRQMTKRHSVGEAMVENVGRMADALDRFANTQDATVTRMRMCWEALDPLDIEESLKYKALAFLEGEMKAATFLALPLESRKRWLLAQLERLAPDF